MQQAARSGAPMSKSTVVMSAGGAAPGPPPPRAAPAAPSALVPEGQWLAFDSLILRDPALSARRGRLEVRPARSTQYGAAPDTTESMIPPPGTTDPLLSRGHFDHRYTAEGLCGLPANGRPTRLRICARQASTQTLFSATPILTPAVFREVELINPFEGPLLAGPVDIFVDGALLRTSVLRSTGHGAKVRFGLGAEDRVTVTRNVRASETSRGLLGGTTESAHSVEIDVASSLPSPASIQILDRLPVTDDRDIEVLLVASRPEARDYAQEEGPPLRGGLEWMLELPPGGVERVEFEYTISLPSKSEVVGGNRRD